MRKKIRRIKRGLAVMLSVCMVFGVAPIQAGAEENDSEIAVQANDSAGKTEQQSTEEEECKHEGIEITFNSNGFGNCPKCNATVYQPAVETTDKYDIDDDSTKDTVYEISNAGQLYWFAGLVNGTLDGVEQNTLANAILMEDITVNDNLLDSLQYDTEGNVSNGSDFITWTPIADWMGNRTTQYSGTFDGNNKTVSGLYFNGNSTCIGLFGSSESDGNIKNVGVVDSYFKGNDHVGGVCGNNAGTITNCYNAGNLTAIEPSATVGGICGYNNGGTVTNCYNTGTVTATGSVASVGGVCGCSIAPISNCYNIGTVTATSSSADISGICGYYFGPIKNCYYLADTEDENGGKTTAQFASGEVAYLLSQGCTVVVDKSDVTYDGSIWGQKLGENGDTYPVLDSTKRVYQVDKYDGCEGKPGSSTKVYSNQSTSIYEEHKYEADTTDSTKHTCSICNGTEEHSFAYEPVENGNAIKATCSECGATYTVKLTQPAATTDEKIVYDGTEKKAGTAIDSGNTGIETIPENAITYATVTNGTPSTYSTTAPKNAGTYKAKLTLGTGDNIVSIEIGFTIEKATPVIRWSDEQKKQSAVYTGTVIASSKLTAPTVTLLSDDTFSDSSKITYSYRKVTGGTASGDFISGLPADIGTYQIKAAIPAEGNYTAAETADTMQLTIADLDSAPDAVVTDKNNKTYNSDAWCPSDIVLKAPNGYKISMEVNGGYEASCTYTGSTENETITYYLRADNSGEIAEKSVIVKMDWTAPDFSSKPSGINIRMNWWNSLLSTITFGLYNGSLDVNIKADDSQSGVAEYYYYIYDSGSTTTLTAEELDTKTFTKVAADKNGATKLTEITSDNDYVIYAYAVDAAGNRSIYISSDGVVLDNTSPKLTNVSAPAKSNETLSDISATITFNGSEAGTYYYILKEDGETAPTVMSDFAAKTAGDKVDTWTAKEGVSTGTLTADEANTIKLTGLKANTSYVLYLAATDAAGNASVVETEAADGNSGIVSVSFNTAKTTPYIQTAPVLSGNYGDTVSAMLEKADKTKASVTAGLNSDTKVEGTWTLASEDADEIPAIGTSEKYTLVFTPTGSDADTYDSVTCEVTPVVSKKQITVVIADKEKFYREKKPALTWSLATGDAYLDNVLVAGDTEEALGISLSTTAKDNSDVGTYAITGSSDSANYEVSFTGRGSDGKSGILTVKQAAQAPNMPQAEMAPAHSTKKVGDITLPDGWSWQEDDKDTTLADGVAVTANAIYTGTDKGNYETESVSITITRSECEHTHTEIRNQREATCKEEGYTGDTYCKDCGEKLATGTTIGKKPHTVGTSATCVSKAVCSVCGETFGEVDANNHVHTTVKNLKEATCTQTGYTGDTYCTDCNKLLGTGKELAALGHDYKATVTKQPTTTEEGIRTYTCSKCGHSYTQHIAKIKTDDSNQNQNPKPGIDNGNNNSTSIKPYIKDDSGKEGWDVIKPQLEEAKSGETVTVAMNGTSAVPKTVIDSIKGKDITLVLDMGNSLSWKINGKEITDAAGDIDFGVTIGADAGKSIPVDVINKVSDERYSMNLSLAYDGEFGFTATLTVNMEPKNSGMYANLFYYNEQTGKLEFVSAGQIDSDGNVELAFTHASDYTIVIDVAVMDGGNNDGTNTPEDDENTEENTTIPASNAEHAKSDAWNPTIIIIIGICILLIVFGAVIFVKKKSGSEKE